MLKIRRPLGRLIFNMGIAIPGKIVFLIETAPCSFSGCIGKLLCWLRVLLKHGAEKNPATLWLQISSKRTAPSNSGMYEHRVLTVTFGICNPYMFSSGMRPPCNLFKTNSSRRGKWPVMFGMEEQHPVTRRLTLVNTLRPRQNGRHFPDDIFKCILLNENVSIAIKLSLKFVVKVQLTILQHWF